LAKVKSELDVSLVKDTANHNCYLGCAQSKIAACANGACKDIASLAKVLMTDAAKAGAPG
jgi:hypothetical protein